MGKFCIGIIMNVFLMAIPNLYVFLSRCNPMPIFFAYIYISYNLRSQKVAMGTNHHYRVWKALKKIHLTCCSLPAVHVILYGYLFHGCLLTPLSSLSTPRPKDNNIYPIEETIWPQVIVILLPWSPALPASARAFPLGRFENSELLCHPQTGCQPPCGDQ
jgi:hypothetical protein